MFDGEEEEHLALADRHINEAEVKIARLRQLLEQGHVLGNLENEGRELLWEMLNSVDVMQIHRKRVLAALADLHKHPNVAVRSQIDTRTGIEIPV